MSTIIKRIDVFSPALLYPLACTLFVISGVAGGSFYSTFLFFIHLVFFLLAFFCVRIFLEKLILVLEKSKPHKLDNFTKFLGVLFSILGVLGFILALSAVSWNIPAIYPWLRRYIPAIFTYASFLLVPACVIFFQEFLLKGEGKKAMFVFFSGLFSISILGYRTEVIVLLISSLLVLWYLQTEKKRLLQKNRKTLLFFGTAFAMAVLLIFTISLARNSVDAIQRSSLTMGVFSTLVKHLEGGEGGGVLHYAIFSSAGIFPGPKTGPRTFISLLIGVEKGSTTSTVLGIPFADFGVGGVILFSIFLGAFFSFAYAVAILRKNVLPMYAICFAFLLVSIETGIADVIVIFYFLVLFVQCVREVLRS